jgi:hypothetical protein
MKEFPAPSSREKALYQYNQPMEEFCYEIFKTEIWAQGVEQSKACGAQMEAWKA